MGYDWQPGIQAFRQQDDLSVPVERIAGPVCEAFGSFVHSFPRHPKVQ